MSKFIKRLLILLLTLNAGLLLADITMMEYYFDNDPGFCNGTSVAITPSTSIDENFTINLSSVSEGFHTLYIRTKNSDGNWSIAVCKQIFKPSLSATISHINEIEYYFDSDPGFGNGTSVSVASSASIDDTLTIDLSTITTGFHTLYIRTKNSNGNWSISTYRDIFKPNLLPTASNITLIEYYFDNDPGFGNGTSVPVTSSTSINKEFVIDLSLLTKGFHTLYIRTKNSDNNWSINTYKQIFKPQINENDSDVTDLEYYFDNDPGFGNGIHKPITSSLEITSDFTIDLSSLDTGFHMLYIRTMNSNNSWSILSYKPIFLPLTAIASDITSIKWYFSGSDADSSEIYSYTNFTASSNITADIIASLIHLTQDNNYQMHMYAKYENGSNSIEQIYPFTLNFIPTNVRISQDNTNMQISWNHVEGTSYYKIYSSDKPFTNFVETVSSIADTTWIAPINTTNKYYYIKAIKLDRNRYK